MDAGSINGSPSSEVLSALAVDTSSAHDQTLKGNGLHCGISWFAAKPFAADVKAPFALGVHPPVGSVRLGRVASGTPLLSNVARETFKALHGLNL